jgi:hypothetical protein
MYYIAIDPSGSFNEGKGHTGMSIIKDWDYDTLEVISFDANKYESRLEYWNAIINTILKYPVDETHVVIESFTIRTNGFLMGKMPETMLFIGAISYVLETLKYRFIFQSPSQAKSRFKDEYLDKYIPGYVKKGDYFYINNKKTNDHIRDSLKHLIYYQKYGGWFK